MQVLIGSGDREVVEAFAPAFGGDRVTVVELASLTEPDAFTAVEASAAKAVVLVPDFSREDRDELRGCWWLARAADLARAPVVLRSSAEVFDGRDRRPRNEFDRPAPLSSRGRLADATEQLVRWTTRRAILARTGPLDRGSGSLAALVGATDGVVGGSEALVSPLDADVLGARLRALAVGRRYGVWHLVDETTTLGVLAERRGWEPPRHGDTPVPPPLVAEMSAMAADIALPSAAPRNDDGTGNDDRTRP